MSELFLMVLNMSFTASYVILFVILIRLPLKKAPKLISYILWSVVGFRLMIPFTFESMFSLMPQNMHPGTTPSNIIYEQNPQINSGIQVIDSSINKILPVPAIGESVNPLQIYLEVGTVVWLLGVILLVSYSILSILKLKRQLKGAQLMQQNIYEYEYLKTPFVLGIISPKIYLPAYLSKEERDYILLHEQTHIKRKDHLIKMVGFFITSINWFNPLVWVSCRLMSLDMEYSCDESVLKSFGQVSKKAYANSLLSLATDRHILNGSPLASGEGNVKGRIKNVLHYRQPKFWILVTSIVILIGVGMMLISNPISNEQDLSFLKPNNMLSKIADKEQIKIISSEYNETFVSGSELAKWLDEAENEWKQKSVLSPYELSPSIVIHIDDKAKNEIRFYEAESTLAMVLYQDEYRYYKIPEEDYLAVEAMSRLGYPQVQHITFTEYDNHKEQTLNGWLTQRIEANSIEQQLSKLQPQEVIEEYFTALSEQDAKTTTYCLSKKSLLGSLTGNMPNEELYNKGTGLPLTDSYSRESYFDNLKSVRLVKVEPLKDENASRTSYKVTVDLQYKEEWTIGSGEQVWICQMVYESP